MLVQIDENENGIELVFAALIKKFTKQAESKCFERAIKTVLRFCYTFESKTEYCT